MTYFPRNIYSIFALDPHPCPHRARRTHGMHASTEQELMHRGPSRASVVHLGQNRSSSRHAASANRKRQPQAPNRKRQPQTQSLTEAAPSTRAAKLAPTASSMRTAAEATACSDTTQQVTPRMRLGGR